MKYYIQENTRTFKRHILCMEEDVIVDGFVYESDGLVNHWIRGIDLDSWRIPDTKVEITEEEAQKIMFMESI